MALFHLASTSEFESLCHLIQCQVLRPTNLDHPIAYARILQRDADETSHVLHRYKIDWIVAAPKEGGLALLQNGLADQLGSEVHECAGAEVLLRAVLDAEELQWRIGTGPLYRNKNEVFRACNLGRIDQLAIARVINRVGIVVALSEQCMGRRQHLLNPPAGAQKGCWIAQVATHHFCSLLLQMSKGKMKLLTTPCRMRALNLNRRCDALILP